MRDYTIYVDGISKSLAATGVRIGWAMGNKTIIDKMKNVIGHVGAWAPKAEQVALANYLTNMPLVDTFLTKFKADISQRLDLFYKGFMQLKKEGFKVNAIEPQAAIYLTVQFDLKGMDTPDDVELTDGEGIMAYLLNEAKVALVPFYAFGDTTDSDWFRISVGTANMEDIPNVFKNLKDALSKLKS
jgi:aspartate aminotransferase